MFLLIVFNIFLESLDPLDIEDYLAEILSNEFNIIIEDGSLVKVLGYIRSASKDPCSWGPPTQLRDS